MNKMSLKCDIKYCCSCGACENICPKKAIELKENVKGVLYPNVDLSKCIGCNLCNLVCPYKINYINRYEKKFFGLINRNERELLKSSSGGAFLVFCHYVISHQGVVFGAYTEGSNVLHGYAETIDECKKFCGAKYTESILGESFLKVKEFLMNNKMVLFSGTPCQINGLKLYLKKDYENLILIDFICHGLPEKRIYKKYINELEIKFNSKVSNIEFRNKKYGWEKYSIKITFENGKEYNSIASEDVYMKIFLSNIIQKECCYNCQIKGDNRMSDITLGDYWGIKNVDEHFYNSNGVSILSCNTKKGEEILLNLLPKFFIINSNENIVMKYNRSYFQSCDYNKNKTKFINQMNILSCNKLVSKFINKTFVKRVFNKISSVVNRLFR